MPHRRTYTCAHLHTHIGDMLKLCTQSEIPAPTELKYVYDLEPIQAKFLRQCRTEWKDAAERMPKLDTYKVVKDFTEPAIRLYRTGNNSKV